MTQAHWNDVYARKGEREVSWFEESPATSLSLIEAALASSPTSNPCIVDVGGGDSRLVDALIARGLTCLAVLDVSSAALERAKARLGGAGSVPIWLAANVADEWTLPPMDVWHDRALFHFLTEEPDRQKYLAHLRATLKVGGSAIIATFDADGPDRCSGLPVVRYSPATLARELGPAFRLEQALHHGHTTPWGKSQAFQYSRFTRVE